MSSTDLTYCKTLDDNVWVVWSTEASGKTINVYPLVQLGNPQDIKAIAATDCVLISNDLEAVKGAASSLMRIGVIVCPHCGHQAKPNTTDTCGADSWFTSDASFSKEQVLGEGWIWLPSLGCPSCGTIFLPVAANKKIVNGSTKKVSDSVNHEAAPVSVLVPKHFNEYLTFNWCYRDGTPLHHKWKHIAIDRCGDVFAYIIEPEFDGSRWEPRSRNGVCMYLYSAPHLIQHVTDSLVSREIK